MKKLIAFVIILLCASVSFAASYNAYLEIKEQDSGNYSCLISIDAQHAVGTLEYPGGKATTTECISWGKQVLTALDPTNSIPNANKKYKVFVIPNEQDLE